MHLHVHTQTQDSRKVGQSTTWEKLSLALTKRANEDNETFWTTGAPMPVSKRQFLHHVHKQQTLTEEVTKGCCCFFVVVVVIDTIFNLE